jgi:hypothetical protein
MQPTGNDSFAEGKAIQGAIGATAGAAIPAAIDFVKGRYVKEVAGRLFNYLGNRAGRRPEGIAGKELNKYIGGGLTVGEESGSGVLVGIENASRQSPYARTKILERDNRIIEQLKSKVDNFITTLNPNASTNAYEVGKKIQQATVNTVNNLSSAREIMAGTEYGLVRELAGNAPVIETKNVVAELQKIIAENAGSTSEEAARVASKSQNMLNKILGKPEVLKGRSVSGQYDVVTGKPMPIQKEAMQGINTGPQRSVVTGQVIPQASYGAPSTSIPTTTIPQGSAGIEALTGGSKTKLLDINTAMKNRRDWSRNSAGMGKLFDDVSPSLDRSTAIRLVKAANKDFAESGTGDIKKALESANGTYQAISESIDAVESSALGKLVGEDVADNIITNGFNTISGEKVVSKLVELGKRSPSELKTAMDIIRKQDPMAVEGFKAQLIKNAFESGEPTAAEMAADVSFNLNRFVKNTPPPSVMTAVGFKQSELNEIKKIVGVSLRLSKSYGKNASGTNVQGNIDQMIQFVGSVVTGSVKGAATIAGKVIGTQAIADAMVSPEGRKALIGLMKIPTSKNQAAMERSATYLINNFGQTLTQE